MDIIQVNDLGKLYRLGEVGTGTLSHDINRWWAKMRGKEDPFVKVGRVNDRTIGGGKRDYVWALKNVSFSIQQGDVVGVIGKNGAGKSTLLKIISRITTPTRGSIKAKGRIASLLEVGTGFHPEMTGRQNIFMNGTLMGMTRREIQSKFDDIVDFAGVSKYVDTPVKRYSSGMTVRLGFAVAAFLEPEILIVDEVLAVGDAEFQKRAIGKMGEISRRGNRTVLFVSHNMKSVEELCPKSILLNNGGIKVIGNTANVIKNYYEMGQNEIAAVNEYYVNKKANEEDDISLLNAKILNAEMQNVGSIRFREPFAILMRWHQRVSINALAIALQFLDKNENLIGGVNTLNSSVSLSNLGEGELILNVKNNNFVPGVYTINIGAFIRPHSVLDFHNSCLKLAISDEAYGNHHKYNILGSAAMYIDGEWDISKRKLL